MENMSYSALINKLEAFNRKKCEIDEQKIRAIFDYIGLTPKQYNENECFRWDKILISVPDQNKFLELQQLETFAAT